MVVHLARGKMDMEDWPVYPGLSLPKKGSLTFLDSAYDEKYTPPTTLDYYKLLQKRTQQRIDFLAELTRQGEIQERFVDSVRLAMITLDDTIRDLEKKL